MFKRTVSFLILVACFQARVVAQAPASAVSYERPPSWRYASEQEWIVSEVVAMLANLASQSSARLVSDVHVTTAPPNGAFPQFLVDASGVQTKLQIRDHIWAAGNYVATLSAYGPGGSTRSTSVTFTR